MPRILEVDPPHWPGAAKHYQVSPRTIKNWIAKGYITGYRVNGRSLAVDLDEVDAFLARTPRTRARDGRTIGAKGRVVDLSNVVLSERAK